MKEITKIVKDYLEMPNTDFALMIKGDWGSGKTYFIKNSLFSYIKGIDSLIIDKNGRKLKYKSFYISLFGVTSSDDMNEKIQLELNSWMNS
jgi:septin family protein